MKQDKKDAGSAAASQGTAWYHAPRGTALILGCRTVSPPVSLITSTCLILQDGLPPRLVT